MDDMVTWKIARLFWTRLVKSLMQALKINLNWKFYSVIFFEIPEFSSSNYLVFDVNCHLAHHWVLNKNVFEMLKSNYK